MIHARWLAAALALAACKPSPPAALQQAPAVAPDAPSAQLSAAPSAAPEAGPLPPEGCWSGAETPDAAREKLESLAAACVQGMDPVAPAPLVVELPADGRKELPFTVTDPSRCVRAAVAGGPGVAAVALSIVDRSDKLLGSVELRAPFAFVGKRGPVCVPSPGVYRAVAHVTHGAGPVAIQVWHAK